MPLTAEQAERWGLVNHVVEGSELLKKAREVAEAIIKNNQNLVLKYKAVINDGLKQDLAHALALEKVLILVSLSSIFFDAVHLQIVLNFSDPLLTFINVELKPFLMIKRHKLNTMQISILLIFASLPCT